MALEHGCDGLENIRVIVCHDDIRLFNNRAHLTNDFVRWGRFFDVSLNIHSQTCFQLVTPVSSVLNYGGQDDNW